MVNQDNKELKKNVLGKKYKKKGNIKIKSELSKDRKNMASGVLRDHNLQ